jgi:acyl-CoA hydrolase
MNPHAVVTMPRHLTGVIVTGYGSADLGGRTVKERAQLLIGIAHLQFRDELSVAAGSLGL